MLSGIASVFSSLFQAAPLMTEQALDPPQPPTTGLASMVAPSGCTKTLGANAVEVLCVDSKPEGEHRSELNSPIKNGKRRGGCWLQSLCPACRLVQSAESDEDEICCLRITFTPVACSCDAGSTPDGRLPKALRIEEHDPPQADGVPVATSKQQVSAFDPA
jgi:hypothetical protein